jgi:hypothetical protein
LKGFSFRPKKDSYMIVIHRQNGFV